MTPCAEKTQISQSNWSPIKEEIKEVSDQMVHSFMTIYTKNTIYITLYVPMAQDFLGFLRHFEELSKYRWIVYLFCC